MSALHIFHRGNGMAAAKAGVRARLPTFAKNAKDGAAAWVSTVPLADKADVIDGLNRSGKPLRHQKSRAAGEGARATLD